MSRLGSANPSPSVDRRDFRAIAVLTLPRAHRGRVLPNPLRLLIGLDRREVLVPQAGGRTAVYHELRARRITGFVAGQIDHEVGDLLGFSSPAQRGLEKVVGNPFGHRGLDEPGMNRVHSNSAWPQFQCGPLPQPADADLGWAV